MVRRKILIAGGKQPAAGVVGPRGKLDADNAHKRKLLAVQTTSAVYPLTAPGLPLLPPTSAFIYYSKGLGDPVVTSEFETVRENGKSVKKHKFVASDALSDLVQAALREPGFTLPVEVGPHRWKEARFLPGHLLGAEIVDGPRPADVMIVSKMPWTVELERARCLSDVDGTLLLEMFRKLKAKNVSKFYVTHLVKFMPPNFKTSLKAGWIKDCMPLLYQELCIVQPKFILCLGSDASKALVSNSAGVGSMEGRVETIRYNSSFLPGEHEARWHEAKVMTVIHPKQVIRDQAAERQLETGIGRFVALTNGLEVGANEDVDHKAIDNHFDLLDALKRIDSDPEKLDSVVAVDAEWHGEHPVNAGSYVRTIQIAWRPKHAIGIKFHEAGGELTPGFAAGEKLNPRTIALLLAFFNGKEFSGFKFRPKRVVGHFFNADLEWLVDLGIDIRKRFSCPLYDLELTEKTPSKMLKRYINDGFKLGESVPAWYRTKYEGGADTGLMCHAIEETASYKLETLAMRYTTAPRYDDDLGAWKVSYCKSKGIKSGDMEGYGECPDEVLLPYGMYDADVTLRLFYKFDTLLDEDYEGNDCREAFWESQIATPVVLEIHQSGITVDRKRIDFLTSKFMAARSRLELELKQEIRWPDFNIRSLPQVKELMFGVHLNGMRDKETGNSVRISPPSAKLLNVRPIFDTSKPPKPWHEIEKRRKTGEHSPSTGKQALSLIARETPDQFAAMIINRIRDHRFLDQVLKTVLRPPTIDSDTTEYVRNEDGDCEYSDGLASMCCDDGKVRTHIYQTKETGRWSSARPNLQNISKQRDPDYKRLLQGDYKYKLRSVLKASPGYVLVEADYVGAELYGMAVMSGDPTMIDHATRNQLPESDPNYYDIHSNVAVFAFKLNCLPTKSGLASIEKVHLRIVAKSVIFGIAYGRGAKAIAVAAKETGTEITVDEAQSVIDAIYAMYPGLRPFFEECQQRATGKYFDPDTEQRVESRYLCNCFGRFRRFPDANGDGSIEAEFGRQAMNFPIQSMIASAVSRALAYIHDYKEQELRKGRDLFRVLLQIHDAILLEVPYEHVKHVCEFVLPNFMRKSVPIYPTTLDGIPTSVGPYYLGLEAEVMRHWGEKLLDSEAKSLGLPTGSASIDGCVINYSKPDPVMDEKKKAGK